MRCSLSRRPCSVASPLIRFVCTPKIQSALALCEVNSLHTPIALYYRTHQVIMWNAIQGNKRQLIHTLTSVFPLGHPAPESDLTRRSGLPNFILTHKVRVWGYGKLFRYRCLGLMAQGCLLASVRFLVLLLHTFCTNFDPNIYIMALVDFFKVSNSFCIFFKTFPTSLLPEPFL